MIEKDKILNKAVDFIAKEEGLRLDAYLCSAGVPTIGYGTTKDVKMGNKCTKKEAEQWLKEYIEKDLIFLNSLAPYIFTQNQIVALLSFFYNMGRNTKLTERLKKRPLDKKELANSMLLYDKIKTNNGYIVNEGLKKRRLREFNLFNKEL
jgi:lysozyme